VVPTGVVLAGRYRLGGRIASGGVGEVWRAADLVLQRPVAVKLLRPEYAQHAETVTRFRAEAQRAGSLSHPGIAHVYDYGEGDPAYPPYLVMELVDGPSLAGVLAGGPTDPVFAMDVVAKAAAGLEAAHTAGLVHRDIKPANLLLTRRGEVKITDFGIAHAAGSAPVTRAGLLVGTPAYLAPERVTGAPAAPAGDLYALGVVAYECLAGVPPFSGDPLEVAAAHRDRTLPLLPPAVPAQTARLVAELTAKDPSARPVSAAQVAERAGRLRDAMAGGTPVQQGLWSALPVAPADPRPATLVNPWVPDPWPAHRWRCHGRVWSGPAVAVAAAAAALIIGWVLASVFGATPPQRPTVLQRSATRPPSASPPRMIEINGGSLAGQPVSVVRERLHELGLRVRLRWQPSSQQPPGTTESVQPSGQVPAGSIVVVTAAFQRHDDNGDGGDDGGGGDNGGGDNGGGDNGGGDNGGGDNGGGD